MLFKCLEHDDCILLCDGEGALNMITVCGNLEVKELQRMDDSKLRIRAIWRS